MSEYPCSYAMLSDTGRVRQKNEDACLADLELGIFVVCDGVGGAAGGEVASQLAARTLVDWIRATREARSSPGVSPEAGLEPDMGSDLRAGIDFANHAVHRQSHERAELYGMATTMVAMLFDAGGAEPGASETGLAGDAGTVWLANVGDSRCYRLRKGALEQLTNDHSLVGEQVRSGLMTWKEAEQSPIRNVITRAVGSEPVVHADVQSLAAQPGDLYLLASDGLTRELSDESVAEILIAGGEWTTEAAPELEPVCAELVRRANKKGGGDNITCLLVRIR